jgi:TRAP-type C4-dicarboxylate transport system substrate-binding protein
LTFNKKSADMKKSLNDELNEGETQMTKKMREEKAEFVKKFQKHQIKATEEEFDKALQGKQIPSVLSVAK